MTTKRQWGFERWRGAMREIIEKRDIEEKEKGSYCV